MTKKEQNDLVKNFIESEYADIGGVLVDLLVFQGIPISTLIKHVERANLSIPDKIFRKKITYFRDGFQNTSLDEDQYIVDKLDQYDEKFIEDVLFSINQADGKEKLFLEGNSLRLLNHDFITEKLFKSLIHAINSLSIMDIKDLANSFKQGNDIEVHKNKYLASGIYQMNVSGGGEMLDGVGGAKLNFTLTETGIWLIAITYNKGYHLHGLISSNERIKLDVVFQMFLKNEINNNFEMPLDKFMR